MTELGQRSIQEGLEIAELPLRILNGNLLGKMQSCQHRPRWFWLIWVNLESILGKLKVIFHCVFVFLPGCYGKGLTMCSPTSEAASRLRRHHIMILLLLLDYPAIFWLPVLIFGIAALILESTSPRC